MNQKPKATATLPAKTGAALLAAACVVLLLAYFATLAGIADGTISSRLFWSVDAPRIWLAFEWWISDERSFWDERWSSSNFFLSIAIIFPLWLLSGYAGGLLVYPLIVLAISAAGWVFLCAAAFGKDRRRSALVIAAHALPLVWMAWFGEDVFLLMLLPVFHFTSFMTIPWSLYLAVRILQGGGRGFVIGFGLLSALSVLNNPVSMPWFFAPFAAALLLMFYADNKTGGKKKRQTINRYKAAFAAMTIGIVAGYLASKAVPFAARYGSGFVYSAPDFKHIINSVINLTDMLALFAKGNPAGALVWLAFVVVAGRKFYHAAFSASRSPAMPVERRLLFLFIPLSMAATAAAAIVTGLVAFTDAESFFREGGFGGKRWMHLTPPEQSKPGLSRHLQPLLFLPLFAGWALYLPAFRAPVMGATLAIVAALAIPRAAELDWQKLDPFAHPFYACMHKAAERLNPKGLISSALGNEIIAYPHWQWREYVRISAARGGRGFLYMDIPHYPRIERASFDFVVANAANGKVSFGTPGRQPFVCDYDKWHQCIGRIHSVLILDGQAIRGAFGEPREVIQCPGNAAIYYYNPPIVLQDIKNHKVVGNHFDAPGWAMPADK